MRLAQWTTVLLMPTTAIAQSPGEVEAGERIFRSQCLGCHSVEPEQNRAGPTLHDLIGREAGALESFDYSDAMRAAGLSWDHETLDAFLAEPNTIVPGTKMVFWGLRPDDRRRVIAYLDAIDD